MRSGRPINNLGYDVNYCGIWSEESLDNLGYDVNYGGI
jgi:hypothetical protein